jgi:hypothetical protein
MAGAEPDLIQEKGVTAQAVSDLLYHSSGLLGVSGVSDDMRTLLASDDPHAANAVALFVYRISESWDRSPHPSARWTRWSPLRASANTPPKFGAECVSTPHGLVCSSMKRRTPRYRFLTVPSSLVRRRVWRAIIRFRRNRPRGGPAAGYRDLRAAGAIRAPYSGAGDLHERKGDSEHVGWDAGGGKPHDWQRMPGAGYASGRRRLESQPSSRTGKNPPYVAPG